MIKKKNDNAKALDELIKEIEELKQENKLLHERIEEFKEAKNELIESSFSNILDKNIIEKDNESLKVELENNELIIKNMQNSNRELRKERDILIENNKKLKERAKMFDEFNKETLKYYINLLKKYKDDLNYQYSKAIRESLRNVIYNESGIKDEKSVIYVQRKYRGDFNFRVKQSKFHNKYVLLLTTFINQLDYLKQPIDYSTFLLESKNIKYIQARACLYAVYMERFLQSESTEYKDLIVEEFCEELYNMTLEYVNSFN